MKDEENQNKSKKITQYVLNTAKERQYNGPQNPTEN
jgi:hypothetical protein